ncbi:hypothetical protein QTJ16_004561 [Diplocarpon rosae]|uniref:Serine hydrolase domain-containing protein n=1 Tax=Diplocarpon rosae TaxID=946125 RepID=A0AAD9WET3_9HELO|nr:hypothetical protein QTJ16_004561 [Diplocarpon rosae]
MRETITSIIVKPLEVSAFIQPMMVEMSKLRVLCLHGFTSNGSVHAHQVRRITKVLSADFEFLFPDGPHAVEITEAMKQKNPTTRAWSEYVAENSKSGHRAWWIARDPDVSKNDPGSFDGLERSLDFLGDLIQKTGPVDAIWGFSQGGCFAGMLMALLSNQQTNHPLRGRLPSSQQTPSAGIFFAGFKPRLTQYDSAYSAGIRMPTLHIIGSQDTIVSTERSETLVGLCEGASLLKHGGGHDIPSSQHDQETVIRFMRENVRGFNSEGREKI